jgi:hypothetical protein
MANYQSDIATKDGVVAEIESLVGSYKGERSRLELGWLINQLWYMGFQWTALDNITGDTTEIANEVRYRANKIQSSIHHSVSKLTKAPPDWDVDTDEGGQSVRAARRVAERYLEYVWEREGMQLKTKDLGFQIRIFGTSFLYTYWDPNKGDRLDPKDYISQTPDGKIVGLKDVLDAFGGKKRDAAAFIKGKKRLHMGDIAVEVLSPFDVYIDPTAEDVRSCQWVMVSKVRHINDIKRRFGKAAKDVRPDDFQAGSQVLKHRLRQYVDPNVGLGGVSRMKLKDAVMLNEWWERPSPEHPNGRYVIYANGQILYYGKNPYVGTEAEIPIVRFRDVYIPGRFHGMAAVTQAIPAQMDYNKARSDQIMARHDHAAPMWLVPNGADVKQIDRRSNRVMRYNAISHGTGAPLKPERMQPAALSQNQALSFELADREIQDVFGVHDVSKGSVPSGVKSGVAIQLLQETDDTRLGSILQEMHEGYATLGRMVLDLSKRYVVEERTFSDVSGRAKGDVIRYHSTDLNWRNVRVRIGSLAQRQRASEQQAAIEFLQYGGIELLESVDQKRMLMKAIGLNVDMHDPDAVHERRALWENTQLEQGIMAEVTDYQNHETHLAILEERMNELSFEELPEGIQELYHQHRQEHLSAMDAKQLRELQVQQALAAEMGSMGSAYGPAGAMPQQPDEEEVTQLPQAY